jgi:hypothetical protein
MWKEENNRRVQSTMDYNQEITELMGHATEGISPSLSKNMAI